MNELTDIEHCRSGAHCRTCRDREGGRAFRRQMVRLFPQSQISNLKSEISLDWPCPLGRPWGWIGPSRGVGDTVAKLIHAATGGLVKPCGGCRKRQAALNRLVPYRRAQ